MTSSPDDIGLLDALRERVATAWDADLFAESARLVVERLAKHLESVQAGEGPVLNWDEPLTNIEVAGSSLGARENATADHVAALADRVLSRGQNLHHPHYIGHQVAPPSPIAGLFDAIGAITNQVMGIYEMGPFTTAIEHSVVDKLGQLIGWTEGSFAGVVTHGGSLANLTALLTARNVQFEDSWTSGVPASTNLCIVANADAHYCIHRAAGVMGLGTNSVINAPRSATRSIDPAGLRDLLSRLRDEGRYVLAVAASSCSTPVGSFDDLNAIADVCDDFDVWFHVDAAHGGGALFSETHRQKLAGIDRADSVVWDAHKMLFVPALCAFVFFKEPEHGRVSFQQKAPYLFDEGNPNESHFDSALRTLECTKRAASLGLWGLWSTFGAELFSDLIDLTFGLARQFHSMLAATDDFEAPFVPEANILVFRYQPDSGRSEHSLNKLHQQLRRELVRSGAFYIVQTELDGRIWFRMTVMNPLTTVEHFRSLMTAIRDMACVASTENATKTDVQTGPRSD